MAVKKLILLFVFSLGINIVKAQCTFNPVVTINPPSNCQACDGSISLNNITGGQSPYTYRWNNLTFNNVAATGLCNTPVILIMTDANLCIDSLLITFTMPVTTINSITTIPNTICGAIGNGSAIVNVTGLAPFTYTLNSGITNTTGNFSNLLPGSHHVNVIDANLCTASSFFTIDDQSPAAAISISITGANNSLCSSNSNCNGFLNAVATGGTGTYSYIWSNFSTNISSNQSVSSLCEGGYYVEVTDINGCQDSTHVSILNTSVSPISITSITTVDNSLCGSIKNGSVSFMPVGGTAPYSYTLNGSVFSSSPTFTGLNSGYFYFLVEDANNCIKYGNFTLLDVSPSILITTTVSTKVNRDCGICNGEINLNVNGGIAPYSYSWGGSIGITTNQTITGLCSNYYSAEVTDANGCTDSVYAYIPNISCGILDGYVFHDSNNNCIYDIGEIAVPDVQIEVKNGTNLMYRLTDNNGHYSFSVTELGTYSIAIHNTYLNNGTITTYCTSSHITSITALVSYTTNNFLVQSNNNCALWANSSVSSVNPGFKSIHHVSVYNRSFVNTSGFLTYTLPDGLTFSNSTPTPVSTYGNSVVLAYSNISMLTNYYVNFEILGNAATSLTIGSTLIATINYDVNCTNIYSYSNPYLETIFVTGPYDPNHKMVWPSQNGYEGDILLTDTELTYKVEFQNIGTAPAVNVVVIDTLSELLDETSIMQMASSHTNNFIYNSKSRQMQWRFNNINLPDSTSNPTGSIGYFTYKVKQKPTNVVGDVIKNTAHIYFDFNSAIVTNTTKSTIVEPESVNEYKQNATKNALFVYPNPSTGIFSLVFNTNSLEKGKLIITDIAGKIVIQQDVESKNGNNVLQINSTDFSSGAYFVSLQFQEKELHQKVIIQK